jgi:hypothetical protein
MALLGSFSVAFGLVRIAARWLAAALRRRNPSP